MCQSELETLFAPFGRIITSRILCDSITGKFDNFFLIFWFLIDFFVSLSILIFEFSPIFFFTLFLSHLFN